MAEITTRRQGEMIQTLFRILDQEPEGLQAKEAIERVTDAMELTDFEKATFPKNPHSCASPRSALLDDQLRQGGVAPQEGRYLGLD